MGDETHTVRFAIPRRMKHLDRLRTAVVDFFSRGGVGCDIVSMLEVATYEAVINIIQHGKTACPDKEIDVECAITESEARVTVTSHGERYDSTAVDLPDIEAHYRSGKKRGLGIFFIRTLMDRVEYEYRDGMNILTMSKKI